MSLKIYLGSDFNDFEDGVQYFCAKNIKDFKNSDILVLTPLDFYDSYIK